MSKDVRKIISKKGLVLLLIAILTLSSLGFAILEISKSRTFQFFGGIISRVNTEEKVVALTFDDGPTEKVDSILQILNDEDVKATFFLIGNEIKLYPEETKKLVLSGQQIGNHTFSHKRMIFKSLSYIEKEIKETDALIREMGYSGTIQFRSPNCKKLILLPYYLKQSNRKNITWNLEPNSFPEINASSEEIAKYVIGNIKPGSIILLHPMYEDNNISVGAIPLIIKGLKEKGYEFKTINELVNDK